jgi:hypothetical protein
LDEEEWTEGTGGRLAFGYFDGETHGEREIGTEHEFGQSGASDGLLMRVDCHALPGIVGGLASGEFRKKTLGSSNLSPDRAPLAQVGFIQTTVRKPREGSQFSEGDFTGVQIQEMVEHPPASRLPCGFRSPCVDDCSDNLNILDVHECVECSLNVQARLRFGRLAAVLAV